MALHHVTTIPAHQLQHYYHLTLSITTILTSSTLNMSNEIFKTDHGNVPKLTDEKPPQLDRKDLLSPNYQESPQYGHQC